MKNARLLTRLGYALAGIATVWRRERSFRTQFWLGAGALVVGGLMVWDTLARDHPGIVAPG